MSRRRSNSLILRCIRLMDLYHMSFIHRLEVRKLRLFVHRPLPQSPMLGSRTLTALRFRRRLTAKNSAQLLWKTPTHGPRVRPHTQLKEVRNTPNGLIKGKRLDLPHSYVARNGRRLRLWRFMRKSILRLQAELRIC